MQLVVPCGRGLLRPNGEELGDDLKRHALRFGDFHKDKTPRYEAHNCIHAEHTSKAHRLEHHGQRVRDNDVANPERKCAYGDAEPTDPGGEDLGAEYVGDWPKSHHEETKVEHDAHGRDRRVNDGAHTYDAAED